MTDEPRRVGRPATGQTPVRTVRIGHIWDEAKQHADERGDKLAVILEEALRRYVHRCERQAGDQAMS